MPTQEPSPRSAWRATPWLKAQMNHPVTGRRNLCLCKLYGLPQKCVCGDCSPLSLCEQAPIGRHSETERMQTTPTTTAWPMRRTKAGGTAYKQKYEHKKHQEQTLMANALTCRLAWQCDRAVPQTATTQPLPTSFPDNLQLCREPLYIYIYIHIYISYIVFSGPIFVSGF